MNIIPKCESVEISQNPNNKWNGIKNYKWLFWHFKIKFNKFEYVPETKEIRFDDIMKKGIRVIVNYTYSS